MDLSEAEFDRIEAYLEGTLSPDERRLMETEIAQDSDLRQAVEEHRVIWEGLQVPVAVEYFQGMHEQLEQQGLLEFDDLWVEAEPSDDAAPEDQDEPEVFVADDPKTAPDDTASHIEVAVDDEPEIQSYPEYDAKPDEWDTSPDPTTLHPPFEDPDDYQ